MRITVLSDHLLVVRAFETSSSVARPVNFSNEICQNWICSTGKNEAQRAKILPCDLVGCYFQKFSWRGIVHEISRTEGLDNDVSKPPRGQCREFTGREGSLQEILPTHTVSPDCEQFLRFRNQA
jgi:hypothetical protein